MIRRKGNHLRAISSLKKGQKKFKKYTPNRIVGQKEIF